MSPVTKNPGGQAVLTEALTAGLPGADIRRWVRRWRRELKLPAGVISVATVDQRLMRRLNRTWRGQNRPTNVLTFRYQNIRGQQPVLRGPIAEILICPPVARREAAAAKISYRARFFQLLRHGLIHVSGRDHRTPITQQRWERLERKLSSGPT